MLSAIGEEVPLRAADFQGKELANIVWAFAVLDYRDTVRPGHEVQDEDEQCIDWHDRQTTDAHAEDAVDTCLLNVGRGAGRVEGKERGTGGGEKGR